MHHLHHPAAATQHRRHATHPEATGHHPPPAALELPAMGARVANSGEDDSGRRAHRRGRHDHRPASTAARRQCSQPTHAGRATGHEHRGAVLRHRAAECGNAKVSRVQPSSHKKKCGWGLQCPRAVPAAAAAAPRDQTAIPGTRRHLHCPAGAPRAAALGGSDAPARRVGARRTGGREHGGRPRVRRHHRGCPSSPSALWGLPPSRGSAFPRGGAHPPIPAAPPSGAPPSLPPQARRARRRARRGTTRRGAGRRPRLESRAVRQVVWGLPPPPSHRCRLARAPVWAPPQGLPSALGRQSIGGQTVSAPCVMR